MVDDCYHFVCSLFRHERRKRNMPDFRYFARAEDTTTQTMPGEITKFQTLTGERTKITHFFVSAHFVCRVFVSSPKSK